MPNGRAGKLTELATMGAITGRPRHYDTPEEFDAKVKEYYDWCKASEEPITWTGLALYLGFSSRQSIDEYKNYPGFSDSVKRAKLLVENAYERMKEKNSWEKAKKTLLDKVLELAGPPTVPSTHNETAH